MYDRELPEMGCDVRPAAHFQICLLKAPVFEFCDANRLQFTAFRRNRCRRERTNSLKPDGPGLYATIGDEFIVSS